MLGWLPPREQRRVEDADPGPADAGQVHPGGQRQGGRDAFGGRIAGNRGDERFVSGAICRQAAHDALAQLLQSGRDVALHLSDVRGELLHPHVASSLAARDLMAEHRGQREERTEEDDSAAQVDQQTCGPRMPGVDAG